MDKLRNYLRLAFLCSIVIIMGETASIAATINVPADYNTIQKGINAAATDDTVLVASGTYTESIFIGKRITVKTTGGAVIDGGLAGRVVTFNAGVYGGGCGNGTDARLEGFTIKNGSGSGITVRGIRVTIENCTITSNANTNGYGGGISLVADASGNITGNALIKNCVIDNNSVGVPSTSFDHDGVEGYGGGISIKGGSPTIENCMISNNTASDGAGGGIYIYKGATPIIKGCTLSGNSSGTEGAIDPNSNQYQSYNVGFGGGIYSYDSSPTIENCTISGNNADAGFGGGIYLNLSNGIIKNSTIANNTLPHNGYGSGIAVHSYSFPTIENCVIDGNTSASAGGGVYIYNVSAVVIKNSQITNNTANTASTQANGAGGVQVESGSSVVIGNCVIADNTGGGIRGYNAGNAYIYNSIIWTNSLYEVYADDAYANIHHVSYSDVEGGHAGAGNIDADPLFVNAAAGDYSLQSGSPCKNAGHPRIQDSDSTVSDMGAAGGDGAMAAATNYVVDINGTGNYTTIQDAIDNTVPGDTVTVLPGTYNENILIARDITLTSQNGSFSTIIDGSGNGSVVVLANLGSTAKIEGFGIQNGSAAGGSGILCLDSTAQISKCVINDNMQMEMSDLWGTGGGGIAVIGGGPTISDCLIVNNQAKDHWLDAFGGGIFSALSTPKIINSTITGNDAQELGGGVAYDCFPSHSVNSSLTILNSILWGNLLNGVSDSTTSIETSGECYADGVFSGLNINYTNIQGARAWEGVTIGLTPEFEGDYTTLASSGVGNINSNPQFVDTAAGDFRLQSGSLSIDAGVSSHGSLTASLTDLERYSRCDPPDMGAFEFAYWYYEDADGDGHGDSAKPIRNCSVIPPTGYVTTDDDCDDSNASRFPGNPELCDGVDNDCDTVIPANEADADGDGVRVCGNDCDDNDAARFPGNAEICDRKDNNCDSVVPADETDDDSDGMTECEGDCNDADAAIYDGAAEICDRKDNNCDGVVPADETDDDNDGFTECENDCNDADAAVNPNSPDENALCNCVDNNCDGTVDEACDVLATADNIRTTVEALDCEEFRRDKCKYRRALKKKLRVVSRLIIHAQTKCTNKPAKQQRFYGKAKKKLKRILKRVNGCAERGAVDTTNAYDKKDWIDTCDSQGQVDPQIRCLITALDALDGDN